MKSMFPFPNDPKTSFFDLLYLFLLASFFLLFDLGKGSLASWDEAMYAESAKQVLLSGDWIRLTWNGQPWVDKPPLATWATAVLYRIFGVGEFGARAFSSFCGVGAVLVTYLMGRALYGRRIGLCSAGVLISSMHFFRMTRFGMMDAPLTFFLSLSLYWFWLGREKERYLFFSGLAFGLALLVKSFAAVFAPLVIGVYCWASGEWKLLRRPAYLAGLAAGCLPTAFWVFLQVQGGNGDLFMRGAVLKHLVERTTQVMQGHDHNWYFYIRTIINKYRPWIVIAVFSAPYFLFRAVRTRAKEPVFVASWMFVIFAVITLMRTKLHWYTLPIYPALSISVGYFLARFLPSRLDLLIKPVFLAVMIVHVPLSHMFDQDYAHAIKGIAPVIKRIPAEYPVFLYNYHEQPAAVFYWDRKETHYLDDPTALREAALVGDAFFCFITEKDMASLGGEIALLGLSVEGSFENARVLKKEKNPGS